MRRWSDCGEGGIYIPRFSLECCRRASLICLLELISSVGLGRSWRYTMISSPSDRTWMEEKVREKFKVEEENEKGPRARAKAAPQRFKISRKEREEGNSNSQYVLCT